MNLNIFFHFFLLLTLALVVIKFYKKLGKIINIYDVPNIKRKTHREPTPVIGGFLIYIIITSFLIFLKKYYSSIFIYSVKDIFIFYIPLTVLFLVGLFDDKFNLNVKTRIVFILSVIFFFVFLDQGLRISRISFATIDLNFLLGNSSIIFSTLCIFILLVSLNMFDGADLQTGIFYILVLFFLLFKTYFNNLFLISIILGFLVFIILNFKGKIFMGDSGIYLCSYLLGLLLIKFYNIQLISVDEILCLLFLPIIDSIRLFFFRLSRGRDPFAGDRQHIHHMILQKYNKKKFKYIITVLIIYPILIFYIFNNIILSLVFSILIYFTYLKTLNK